MTESWRAVAAGVALAAWLSASAGQPEAVKLEYGLEAGDLLEYRIEMSSSVGGRTTRIVGAETLVVTGADGDGTLSVVSVPSGTRMLDAAAVENEARTMDHDPFFGPAGWPLAVDPGSGLPVNPYFGLFEGRVARSGRVVESTIGGFLPRNVTPAAIGEWGQNFPTIGLMPWIEFPADPVQVGATWTQRGFADAPLGITLKGLERRGGRRVARVRVVPDEGRGWTVDALIDVAGGFVVHEEIAAAWGGFEESLLAELVRRERLTHHEIEEVRRDVDRARSFLDADGRAAADSGGSGGAERLVGRPSPGFSLRDASGRRVERADFDGRVLLLNFCVSWWPSCNQMLANLRAVDGPAVMAVTIASDAERAIGAADAAMSDLQILSDYRVEMVPLTFLIDGGGVIRAVFTGYRSKTELEAAAR